MSEVSMSEVMSFGNIVNSLRSVRNDYNEQLKSVPQYEAFLLVESSTSRVADTLQGVVNSGAPSMAAEVIAALEVAKTKFREHLTSVPEYRTLLAIDKLISEVAADLGATQAAPQVPMTSQAQTEPASTDVSASSETDSGEQSSADPTPLPQVEISSPSHYQREVSAQTEAAEQAPPVQADVDPELTALATAISQVHLALQPPELPQASAHPPEAEPAPSQPNEPTESHPSEAMESQPSEATEQLPRVEPYSFAQPEIETPEPDREKAA